MNSARLLIAGLALAWTQCTAKTAVPPQPADATTDSVGDAVVTADAPTSTQTDTAELAAPPTPEFARFCQGRDWLKTRTPAVVGALTGTYKGSLDSLGPGKPFKKGTLETMKFIPEQPFHLTGVRAAFAKGSGDVRIRVMQTQGRTYPGPFPKMKDLSLDLVPPLQVTIDAADPENSQDFTFDGDGAWLLPTQHYMIVYEHLQQGPALALETVPAAEFSRALLFMPNDIEAYGLSDGKQDYNYRLEVLGETGCQWKPDDFLFAPEHPFGDQGSGQIAVTDLNGDGKDDVVLTGSDTVSGVGQSKPLAFWGDGHGGYTPAATDVFAAAKGASIVAFGDIDNDGDADVLAMTYISRDGDGDGHQVPGDDCDDTDAAVYLGAPEIVDGKDNDCNGIADTGTNTDDADKDGVTIAKGDCDDTHAETHPGATEVLDGRDNDCDGQVDEDFVDHILRNDGKGQLSVVANSGVEALDPSTATAFSDANADGKLDVYWGNWLVHYPDDPAVQDRYFTGNGDGTFTDALVQAGLQLPTPYSVYGLTWCDYNNDGAQDLFVGNYHLYPDQLWKNLGLGTFVDVAPQVGLDHDAIAPAANVVAAGLTGGHTYGADFGDVDNDGDMDVYVCNLAHPRTQPWADISIFGVNQGSPDFAYANQTKAAGFIYDEGDLNAFWGDYDNDGDLDLVVASIYTGHYSRLYRNEGQNVFTDVSFEAAAWLHQCGRVLWFDADDDGDLDLLFTDGNPQPPHVHLLRNRMNNGNHWLELNVQGTSSARDAPGARVTVKTAGTTQMRDVKLGGGHWNPQTGKRLHFGLGSATKVDQVQVHWVGGAIETFSGIAVDKRWTLVQGTGKAVP